MKRLDHVAIAVSDLRAAEEIYREIIGLEFVAREEVSDQKVQTSIFRAGASRIELICPTSPDSPIAGFLEKRGPGLHHLCFEVADLQEEIARLKARGVRLLNETPRPGVEGSQIVFLHPKEGVGVLIELTQKSAPAGTAPR